MDLSLALESRSHRQRLLLHRWLSRNPIGVNITVGVLGPQTSKIGMTLQRGWSPLDVTPTYVTAGLVPRISESAVADGRIIDMGVFIPMKDVKQELRHTYRR